MRGAGIRRRFTGASRRLPLSCGYETLGGPVRRCALAGWTNDPPEDLIREAREGGEPAFGRLLSRYTNYLTLLARVEIGRRLQGKVDAADLVQDTFLEAHRHFPAFRGTTEPEV